ALREALGGGGTGKGAVAAGRGAAAALKELEKQQKLRSTRAQRDALDRALVDLAGLYRDVLTVQTGARVGLFHVDREADVRRLARSMAPEGTLVRIEAILHARAALELNVKQLVAMEAMTVVLRSGRPT
nr:DNA polymerase III subunit delta' [Geodermatophilaceae bacterium]